MTNAGSMPHGDGAERHESIHRPEHTAKKIEHQKGSEHLKPHLDAAAQKTAEYVEIGESAEVAGEVSEILSKQRDQQGSGSVGGISKGARAKITAAQIKANLLKKAPTQEVMMKEVKKEIEKEINYLHKRARKALRGSSVSAFELNNIVKKIRELKALLLTIAKATAETIKTLWLRFVHGVM
jgi:hypothetical protein